MPYLVESSHFCIGVNGVRGEQGLMGLIRLVRPPTNSANSATVYAALTDRLSPRLCISDRAKSMVRVLQSSKDHLIRTFSIVDVF